MGVTETMHPTPQTMLPMLKSLNAMDQKEPRAYINDMVLVAGESCDGVYGHLYTIFSI